MAYLFRFQPPFFIPITHSMYPLHPLFMGTSESENVDPMKFPKSQFWPFLDLGPEYNFMHAPPFIHELCSPVIPVTPLFLGQPQILVSFSLDNSRLLDGYILPMCPRCNITASQSQGNYLSLYHPPSCHVSQPPPVSQYCGSLSTNLL